MEEVEKELTDRVYGFTSRVANVSLDRKLSYPEAKDIIVAEFSALKKWIDEVYCVAKLK